MIDIIPKYLYNSTINNIIYYTMNNTLTAQELKVKGAQILKEKMKKTDELIITVRGKNSYVVLSMKQYEHLRQCELEAAVTESQSDLQEGKFTIKSVKQHIKDLKHV